jgi:hypothetical protein
LRPGGGHDPRWPGRRPFTAPPCDLGHRHGSPARPPPRPRDYPRGLRWPRPTTTAATTRASDVQLGVSLSSSSQSLPPSLSTPAAAAASLFLASVGHWWRYRRHRRQPGPPDGRRRRAPPPCAASSTTASAGKSDMPAHQLDGAGLVERHDRVGHGLGQTTQQRVGGPLKRVFLQARVVDHQQLDQTEHGRALLGAGEAHGPAPPGHGGGGRRRGLRGQLGTVVQQVEQSGTRRPCSSQTQP